MDVVTYSDARANLKKVMERVVEDRTQIVVTRQQAEPIVMLSLSDWNSMAETMHLLGSRTNAERLRDSIRRMDDKDGTERDLIQA